MQPVYNPNPNPRAFIVPTRMNGFTAYPPSDIQSIALDDRQSPTYQRESVEVVQELVTETDSDGCTTTTTRPKLDKDGKPVLRDVTATAKTETGLAYDALKAYGLAAPQGRGRLVFYICDRTAQIGVTTAALWNAGRVSHRPCCRSLPVEALATRAPAEFVIQKKLLGPHSAEFAVLAKAQSLGRVMANALAAIRGELNNPEGSAVTQYMSNHQLTLQTFLNGRWVEHTLQPSTLRVFEWADNLASGHESQQPVFTDRREDLAVACLDVQSVIHDHMAFLKVAAEDFGILQSVKTLEAAPPPMIVPAFLWRTIAVVDDDNNPVMETVTDSRGHERLVPKYQHHHTFYPRDISRDADELDLKPEVQAALALMAMQNAVMFPELNADAHEVFTRFKLKRPENLRGERWFRVVPAQKASLESAAKLARGNENNANLETRLVLLKRPPGRVFLPANWESLPRQWDWSTVVPVDVLWPRNFLEVGV